MSNDLNYYKKNCESEIPQTPISVLKYISQLEKELAAKDKEMERFKELLCDAYASAWRKSKKHQKQSNFLGLNRTQINEYFETWYKSKTDE